MDITLSGDGASLVLTHVSSSLQFVRELPGRQFHAKQKCWTVPYVREVYDLLKTSGKPIQHLPRPERSGYEVTTIPDSPHLLLTTLGTAQDTVMCRRIPEYRLFSQKHGGWVFKRSTANIRHIEKNFPQAVWGPGTTTAPSRLALGVDLARPGSTDESVALLMEQRADGTQILDYQFKTVPFNHQAEVFVLSRDKEYFALLMEPGTGKTKVLIDTAAWLYLQGLIDGVLVTCPNSVKDTWIEELETHLPNSITPDIFLWEPRTKHKFEEWCFRAQGRDHKLRWLIMNVEAFSAEQGEKAGQLFVAKHTVLMGVDESTRIKSPVAKRTKRIVKIGRNAAYRRILSGLPAPQSPLDYYSQFKFLSPDILPFSTYYGFRNRYALMGGFNGKIVTGYHHLEELQGYIKPHSYRKTADECLDLPDKVYEKISVDLSPEQQRLYDQMRDEMIMELEGVEVTVEYALQKMNKLARITGGFFSYETLSDDETMVSKHLRMIPGGNPKLDALLEDIEEAGQEKIIIWAKFRAELDMINEALIKQYGEGSTVLFHGKVANHIRQDGRRAFQRSAGGPRFFVGQPQAGGIGLTLTRSARAYYFSNDFDLEARIQSEKRIDRATQQRSMVFTDVVARNTLDIRLRQALRRKKGLSDLITGDKSLKWI